MAVGRKVRVLVVDDSILFRRAIIDRLSKYGYVDIIGYAVDAFDAQRKIPGLAPDVIILDVEMPRMSGIELLKKLTPEQMVPVVLVSALNMSVFDALSVGAVDFVRKPDINVQNAVEDFVADLARKIFVASRANIGARASRPVTAGISGKASITNSPKLDNIVIALGASTGGTEATLEVLKRLPADTPGMVVVQHMPPGFTKMYADRLNNLCAMEVKEAENGDRLAKGRVLLAPGDFQMKVVKVGANYSVMCYKGEKVSGHCPSVDVLFNSVADNIGADAVGIILTGMGKDGADGLLKMRERGAFTIGQDKESCVVYGMPAVAYDIGAVVVQAPCVNIADVLMRRINQMTRY